MKTLPKLSEYIFKVGLPENTDTQFADKVMLYTNFITQTLNLSHFVPAIEKDGEWIVLEEMKEPEHQYNDKQCDVWAQYEIYKNRYQKALDNIVFKGWYIDFRDLETIVLSDANNNIIEFKENGDIYIFDEYLVKLIEDAIFYSERENINLEVTETIIKKFNL